MTMDATMVATNSPAPATIPTRRPLAASSGYVDRGHGDGPGRVRGHRQARLGAGAGLAVPRDAAACYAATASGGAAGKSTGMPVIPWRKFMMTLSPITMTMSTMFSRV